MPMYLSLFLAAISLAAFSSAASNTRVLHSSAFSRTACSTHAIPPMVLLPLTLLLVPEEAPRACHLRGGEREGINKNGKGCGGEQ